MFKKKSSEKVKKEETTPKEAAKPEQKITKSTLILQAARMCPDAAEIMMSHGLHCIGCGMTAYETIEQGCIGHGMSQEEIQQLVDELNEALEKHSK
jgi:hybrid cluster-associated redox disulfide protein